MTNDASPAGAEYAAAGTASRRRFLLAGGLGAAVVVGMPLSRAASGATVDYVKTADVWQNVRSGFGAVGDGTTDDVAAIQAALDRAGSTGGGAVYLPPGTYAVGDTLRMPNDVTLLGAGRRSTTLTVTPAFGSTSSNRHIVQVNSGTRVQVRDLTITGDNSAGQVGVAVSAGVDCRVERCQFTELSSAGNTGWGVYVSDSSRNVVITACLFRHVGGNGVELNNSSYCSVVGNRLSQVGNNGVEVYMSLPGEVLGNRISGNLIDAAGASGIACFGDTGTVITENTVTGAGSLGVYLTNSELLGAGYPSALGTLSDNVVSDAGVTGILIAGAQHWVVSGNACSRAGGFGGQGGHGIHVSGRNNTVTANVCGGNRCHGILVNGSGGGSTLTGNVCNDNSTIGPGARDGIRVEANGVSVVANRCTDTRTPKLQNFGVALIGASGCLVVANLTGGNASVGVFDNGTNGRVLNDDGSVLVPGKLQHTGSTAAFYGAAPVPRPSVTGSRSGGTALPSLLQALQSLGLVTDGTTT